MSSNLALDQMTKPSKFWNPNGWHQIGQTCTAYTFCSSSLLMAPSLSPLQTTRLCGWGAQSHGTSSYLNTSRGLPPSPSLPNENCLWVETGRTVRLWSVEDTIFEVSGLNSLYDFARQWGAFWTKSLPGDFCPCRKGVDNIRHRFYNCNDIRRSLSSTLFLIMDTNWRMQPFREHDAIINQSRPSKSCYPSYTTHSADILAHPFMVSSWSWALDFANETQGVDEPVSPTEGSRSHEPVTRQLRVLVRFWQSLGALLLVRQHIGE